VIASTSNYDAAESEIESAGLRPGLGIHNVMMLSRDSHMKFSFGSLLSDKCQLNRSNSAEKNSWISTLVILEQQYNQGRNPPVNWAKNIALLCYDPA
jgi:hypothetical protein